MDRTLFLLSCNDVISHLCTIRLVGEELGKCGYIDLQDTLYRQVARITKTMDDIVLMDNQRRIQIEEMRHIMGLK